MKSRFLFGLLLVALSAHAAPRVIATINDPAGDDNGNGNLIYPQRTDFEPGDLDLLQLQVSRDDEGYWFEATFKNPIRNPASAFGTIGSEPLSNVARKGFYQFNLDIYIDTDRVKGSGDQFTLPGRKVSIDPAYAWEKAVILTPRPEAVRAQLLEVLERQFPDRPKGEAAASIDQSMFFPTQVRVRNKSVIFLVPAKFLGPGDANDWALTAFVTGAKIDISVNLPFSSSGKTPLEELSLGVMQPVVGRPSDTFGYAGGSMPSPVVDVLTRGANQQVRLLAPGASLTGVSLNASAANLQADAAAVAAKPAPPGPTWGDAPAASSVAAGATETAAQPAAGGSVLSRPFEAVKRLFQADPQPAASAVAPVPVPVQELLQPGKRAEPRAAAAEQTAPAARPSIAKRLEALQQLFDQKIVTEDEYKQQRQRILNEL
jgi:C-terminal binding-module, SLH-like, of glucodextranase